MWTQAAEFDGLIFWATSTVSFYVILGCLGTRLKAIRCYYFTVFLRGQPETAAPRMHRRGPITERAAEHLVAHAFAVYGRSSILTDICQNKNISCCEGILLAWLYSSDAFVRRRHG